MIIIVNYGMGNLGSVQNMFKKVGAQSKISSDLKEIEEAEKLLLPGVGAFDKAMQRIEEVGMLPILNKKANEDKIPILGICLGMQLLTEGSEEGQQTGLGWIPAKTLSFKKKFETMNGHGKLRVPHMGWNTVQVNHSSDLTFNFFDRNRFYFVHSYYVKCDDDKDSMLKTNYGFEFDSAIHRDNIYGAQFHPEKSHKFGMRLLDNFNRLT